ncbi:MAG: LamG-like jellyroll fold domain-containing protein [Bacteroidia bacterium]
MKKILLTVAAGLTMFSAVAQTKPVANWTFNNGNANDEAGSNNGVVNGATLTTDRFGNANKAYNFVNGQSIAIPHNDTLKSNTMSVSLWAKVNAYNSSSLGLIHIYSVTDRTASINIFNFTLGVRASKESYLATSEISSHSLLIESADSLVKKNWDHIVAVMGNDSLKLYINNVLIAKSRKTFTTTFSNDSIFIGASGHNGFPGFFNGSIDDIRVYNRILSEREIDSLFREPNPFPSTGLNTFNQTSKAINVYPNPAKSQIQFSENASVKMLSISGQVIAEVSNASYIDIEDKPSGIYMLIFTDINGNVLQRTKIIKD